MAISERNMKIVESIEAAFTDYLSDRSNNSRLQISLSKLLSTMDITEGSRRSMDFDIWITGRHKEPSFFMCITPVDTEIVEFSKLLGEPNCSLHDAIEKWNRIDKWVLEIEEEILNPQTINFTPLELTAMLLHEIGHVIYSNSVPEKIYNGFQASRLRMMKTKDFRKIKLFANFLAVPVNLACAVTSNIIKRGTKLEFEADAYVLQYGNKYGEALASALDKIINTFGTTKIQDSTHSNKSLAQEMDWAMVSIKEAIARSGKIKNELAYRAARAERKTMKALCIRIMNAFGIAFKDSYSNAPVDMAMESFDMVFEGGTVLPSTYSLEYIVGSPFGKALEASRSIEVSNDMLAIEAFVKSKHGKKDFKSLLPTQYDIDNIMIEIDRIKTHQDRIFVLDLIYNKLEDLAVLQEAMDNDPNLKRKYGTQVDNMVKQLNALREVVLNKKNLDKKYKLWVQVPAGYEG